MGHKFIKVIGTTCILRRLDGNDHFQKEEDRRGERVHACMRREGGKEGGNTSLSYRIKELVLTLTCSACLRPS